MNKLKEFINKRKDKIKKATYSTVDFVTDIFLIPVLILLVFFSINNVISKTSNKIVSIFGYSPVTILSSSMVASGFKVNDLVIIKKTDSSKLEVNDIIAFYVNSAEFSEYPKLEKTIDNSNYTISSNVDYEEPINKIETYSNAKTIVVYFHHITKIVIDEDGKRWFRTKGSSNSVEDSFWTKEASIVGRYVNAPSWVTGTIKYLASNNALIWIVILPGGILFMLNIFPFFEYCDLVLLEHDILKKKMKLDDPMSLKKDVPPGMLDKSKVTILKDASLEDKERYFKLMWGFNYKDLDLQKIKIQNKIEKLNIKDLMVNLN